MAKKPGDGRPQKGRPRTAQASPPPLSEELIAKLQGAVEAAQRKRMKAPDDAPRALSVEEEFSVLIDSIRARSRS
jgi:hypothetical protein